MRYLYIFFFLILIFPGCAPENQNTSDNPDIERKEPFFFSVTATHQTDAGLALNDQDAMDDAAIWYNTQNPEQSLILGANKKLGLEVYGLRGSRILTDSVGRINNIDLRDDFQYMGQQVAVVGASNRDNVGIDLWVIHKDQVKIEYVTKGSIPTGLNDVYGFCMYKSPVDQKLYAFINSKTGAIQQWLIHANGANIEAQLQRTLKLETQVEGMVADDELAKLYVGEEDKGVFEFDAEPDAPVEGRYIPLTGEDNSAVKYDVEGLTLVYGKNKTGYLIVSSQGNNTYAVFERSEPHKYLGSFNIVDGQFDGTQDTDGIDVSTDSFGDIYPNGFFIVQDGFNTENGDTVAQNFKMVDWKTILEGLE
ncbi:MAG TPA: 3-phytase [Flavobacteriales bacterium]|jgi:3-phytase|nr:3-phytase [Flavobacteriales bacterium]